MPLKKVDGFKSSPVFQEINTGVQAKPELAKKANAVFQFDVKNSAGKVESWTLNFKTTEKDAMVVNGKASKADITISLADDDFVALASGKLNGQKAFMQGKLKVKGNMMLATKVRFYPVMNMFSNFYSSWIPS